MPAQQPIWDREPTVLPQGYSNQPRPRAAQPLYPPYPPYANVDAASAYPYSPWPALEFTASHLPHPHARFEPASMQPPPPAPPAHKVWLLDCKSCQTFLTNRGMRAVLLLRPHVPLYSTDALPVNCSAHGSVTQCSPAAQTDDVPRTCECLTQTLCCHGCGSSVGYMIVIPCARCTSSVSGNNRSTNGHRFVFHSAEVVASERHYVPHEPGVLPIYTPAIVSGSACGLPSPPDHGQEQGYGYETHDPVPSPVRAIFSAPQVHPSGYAPYGTQTTASDSDALANSAGGTSDNDIDGDEDDDDELGDEGVARPAGAHQNVAFAQTVDGTADAAQRRVHPSSAPEMGISSNGAQVPAAEIGAEPKHVVRPLKAGAVLFWHHLTRAGEIPGVRDDPRARSRKMMAYDR